MIRIVFNTDALAARLTQGRRVLGDLTPVHQEIGEYLVDATKQRFIDGKAPDGTAWRAKSAATLARYKRQGDGNRPKPLIGPSGRLGREIGMAADRGSVEIGSALEYSGVMQDGAAKGAFGNDKRGRPLPWGDIPARVWLGLSPDDETNILDIVDEAIAAGLGEAGA